MCWQWADVLFVFRVAPLDSGVGVWLVICRVLGLVIGVARLYLRELVSPSCPFLFTQQSVLLLYLEPAFAFGLPTCARPSRSENPSRPSLSKNPSRPSLSGNPSRPRTRPPDIRPAPSDPSSRPSSSVLHLTPEPGRYTLLRRYARPT
jgi:hypothetical protein